MPGKVVRYGVIGCGAIAQRRHICEAEANPRSQVVAVADPAKGRAAQVAEGVGAAAYIDYRKMLAGEDLDAVVVATPNALHAEHALAGFKAGCHVLVEKPMAGSRADAKKMIAAAKRAKKYLMVGMNQRMMPAHLKAKRVLDSGAVGRVLAFETSFKHPGPDGWSVDGDRSWFFKKAPAVMGVNGDLGVHKVDLMRWLLGEEFTRVGGIITTLDKRYPNGKLIGVDDCAYLTLQTRSGVVGSCNIAWTHYGCEEDNGTVLYCTGGVIKIGVDPQFGVVVRYRDGQAEYHQTGAMASNTSQTASGVIDTFTGCLLKKKAPAIDGAEGYKSLNVILTAFEAARTGTAQKIRA